jgi:hypothetical protein
MPKFHLAILFLLCLFLVAIPESGFAAAGTLDSPSVATSSSYPQAHRVKLLETLKRKDCKFISGSWINSSTQLHYHGDAKALGQFLTDLTNCPGVTVSISFYRPGGDFVASPEESNWSVFHSAINNHFQVKINADSKDLDLTMLYIPPLKGE